MPPISRSGGGGGKSDSLHWPAGPWSLPRSSVFKPVANTQKKKNSRAALCCHAGLVSTGLLRPQSTQELLRSRVDAPLNVSNSPRTLVGRMK